MSLFALVDCNNFYVSCERVFQPHLNQVPVAVLSNNDGCIIARSNEVKALGVPMGAPLHEYHQLLKKHNVQLFSSNYTLYGDMSARVMDTLRQFSNACEVYSIDEMFLQLPDDTDPAHLAFAIRDTVQQWLGLPISVGIGSSKTLAKVANRLAKKSVLLNNQCVFSGSHQRSLSQTPVADVWGVGRRWAKRLNDMGIMTAADLKGAEPQLIRKRFNVILERTVHELNGTSCIPLEMIPPTKQQIAVTRSFGEKITHYEGLRAAIATHTCRAAEKMRQQKVVAQAVQVFIRTNPFAKQDSQYHPSIICPLLAPTSDTNTLLTVAIEGLKQLYQPGFHYKKAGVMMLDLIPESIQQSDYLLPSGLTSQKTLMASIDAVNQKFGRGTLTFGATQECQQFKMKNEQRSPSFTTNWDELVTVK